MLKLMEARISLYLFSSQNIIRQSVGITDGQAGRNFLEDLWVHDEHLHNVRSLKSNYACVCVCVCFCIVGINLVGG